jgi:hypothetical protein
MNSSIAAVTLIMGVGSGLSSAMKVACHGSGLTVVPHRRSSTDLLTRKMEISWACGSGPWPSGPVRACGRYGSGGLGRACPVGFGFGDAADGDFEAEGSERADVVGDLAAGVALAVVVVRAEVLISHAGVG